MNCFMKKYSKQFLRSLLLTASYALLALQGACGNGGLPSSAPNPDQINGMYVHSFGDSRNTAVIFIHDSLGDASTPVTQRALGGPSLNSMFFEFGVAARLAASGYFVISYDLRGQGRSADARTPSDYSYKQSADDIKSLIAAHAASNPIIIGHSHGGIIALKFDEFYPGASRKIVLVNTPLDMFQALNTISANCQSRYSKVGESSKVSEIKNSLDTLANASSPLKERSTSVVKIFEKAGTCGGNAGLYSAASAAPEAVKFYQMMSWLRFPVSDKNQSAPVDGFLINEDFIHINQTAYVTAHNDHIVGMYGSEDKLFDADALAQIKTSLGADAHPERMVMIDSASHNVFIDQSVSFVKAFGTIVTAK